jgi:membrane protease YdiL (CAAX protease family)
LNKLPPQSAFAANLSAKLALNESVKRLSRAVGAGVLLSGIMEVSISIAIRYIPGLLGFFDFNDSISLSYLSLIGTVLMIFPGALLTLHLYNPWEHNLALPYGKPFANTREQFPRATSALCVLAIGLLLCNIGNVVSGVVLTGLGNVGVDIPLPDYASPQTGTELLFDLLAISIAAAFAEELFLRGVVLQPLRRYGDNFAIVLSAILFALLHKNLAQAPMAFVAGLGLGWAAVRTGSLWISICIHAVNNAVSVLSDFAVTRYGDEFANRAYLFYTSFVFLCAVVSGIVLFLRRNDLPKFYRQKFAVGKVRLGLRWLLGTWQMVFGLIYLAAMFVLNTFSDQLLEWVSRTYGV